MRYFWALVVGAGAGCAVAGALVGSVMAANAVGPAAFLLTAILPLGLLVLEDRPR